MADTNSTSTRKTVPLPSTSTSLEPPSVVGPAARPGEEAVVVRLSHHLRIGGREYAPGAEILVADDYARRLRSSGYVARS